MKLMDETDKEEKGLINTKNNIAMSLAIKRISDSIPKKIEDLSKVLPSEKPRLYYNNNFRKRPYNITKDYIDWLFDEHEDVYGDECEKVLK